MPISLAICALGPLDEFSEKKRFSKNLQIGPFICQWTKYSWFYVVFFTYEWSSFPYSVNGAATASPLTWDSKPLTWANKHF